MSIWWCEVHTSAGQRDETRRCRAHWMVEQISDIKPSPCRMVEMQLLPLDHDCSATPADDKATANRKGNNVAQTDDD